MIQEQNFVLPVCNFPTKWQAVLFRNIGMVPLERIAAVLHTDENTLLSEAERLGIADVKYDPNFEKQGYLTIIRSNWYLLPTKQLTELLRCTEEELFYTLRDEDFLIVKLGHKKPSCEAVYYRPLSAEEIEETEKARLIISSVDVKDEARRFDFFKAKSADFVPSNYGGTRFIHGYLTPCGDAFLVDSEEYLSDELLSEYSRQGVNGIWMHGLLATLSPYPFISNRDAGYRERRKNLNKLIERCAKYGIKTYIYFNEPRCLPPEIGPKFPELTGHILSRGYSLCMCLPEIRRYLYDAFLDLLKECPIGGIMTITMSENPTHCRSKELETNCPRCKNVPFEELAATVNNIIKRAIDDSGRDTELIANLWSWSTARGWTKKQIIDGINLLDKGISVLLNSEFDLSIVKGGVAIQVEDYSISNPGPSAESKAALIHAKSCGHKVYAKIQANNSWECSVVPYLPLYDLIKEHIDNLAEIGVENFMLSWTLGGYPSPTLNYIANYRNMSLDEWYESYYGELSEVVKQGVRIISDSFREYPFACNHIYFSPQTLGPYNMWSANPEEKRSTMVCFAYDDYELWIDKYPYDVFVAQTGKMLNGWKMGIDILKQVAGKNKEVDDLIRYAEVAYIHLRADLIHTKYAYMKRDIRKYKNELIALARESAEDAKELSLLAKYDATIGYEASNHYFYTPHLLREKLLNTEKFINDLNSL